MRALEEITADKNAAEDKKSLIERALRFVEETIPTPMIGISMAEAIAVEAHPFDGALSEIMKLIDFTYTSLIESGRTSNEAIERIGAIEPFLYFPDALLEYRRSLT